VAVLAAAVAHLTRWRVGVAARTLVVALMVGGMPVAVIVAVVAHTVVVDATNPLAAEFWRSTNQKWRSIAALPLRI
jgi:hypothetical protein